MGEALADAISAGKRRLDLVTEGLILKGGAGAPQGLELGVARLQHRRHHLLEVEAGAGLAAEEGVELSEPTPSAAAASMSRGRPCTRSSRMPRVVSARRAPRRGARAAGRSAGRRARSRRCADRARRGRADRGRAPARDRDRRATRAAPRTPARARRRTGGWRGRPSRRGVPAHHDPIEHGRGRQGGLRGGGRHRERTAESDPGDALHGAMLPDGLAFGTMSGHGGGDPLGRIRGGALRQPGHRRVQAGGGLLLSTYGDPGEGGPLAPPHGQPGDPLQGGRARRPARRPLPLRARRRALLLALRRGARALLPGRRVRRVRGGPQALRPGAARSPGLLEPPPGAADQPRRPLGVGAHGGVLCA